MGGHVTHLSLNQLSDVKNGILHADIGCLTSLDGISFYDIPGLGGKIPTTMGNLVMLISFAIYNTRLSGQIPASIKEMKELRFLSLQNNRLTGPIPDSIGQMPELRDIWLTENQLSGHLLPSLGDLPSLSTLYLSGNSFSGSIPATLPATLKALQFNDNSFIGEIPKSSADLKYLSDINLSQNQPSGDTSMLLFGASMSGTDIYLYQNRFRFNFSKVVESPCGLIALDLSHNLIYVIIPYQIGYAAFVAILDLS